jgi:Zn-dependent M28 family amino/carboxypeptidase
MTHRLFILITLFTFALMGCQYSATVEEAASTITEESLLSHIEVLSSDEFEGRAPATAGDEKTTEYLVSEFQKMGVEPGMDDGSYTQEVPLLGQVVSQESASLTIKKDGEPIEELEYRTEFMAWPSNEAETVDLKDAELVYVGYGIQAPEFDWDDYKDADVEGKVLVFKNSDPAYSPDIFEGDARLYYGRWSYKFEKAEEMGALGAIIVHTMPTAGYGWLVVANSWGRERFALKSDDDNSQKPAFNSWMTANASQSLFSQAGLNLGDMLEAADDPEFTPVPLEGVTLDVFLEAEYSDMSTQNIVGKIEGNDPELKEQYVIFSAHQDHLGISMPVEGDSINNGALDNAAGVSSVLNIAAAYKQVEDQMKRSALFLFVGAEEMGLLGSQYWAANPTVHPGSVTANFNMDGMQVYGETSDVVLVGYGRNSLTDVIEKYAAEDGRVVKPDPNPAQGFFYRSDHFSFAKVGIPAIFPNPGRDYIGKPEDWNETVDSLRARNYHSVGDEINEYWDLAGMEKDVRLFFRSSFDVLNADGMMEWNEGDEFKATREEMLRAVE